MRYETKLNSELGAFANLSINIFVKLLLKLQPQDIVQVHGIKIDVL